MEERDEHRATIRRNAPAVKPRQLLPGREMAQFRIKPNNINTLASVNSATRHAERYILRYI
jgi:hypothetical protein